MKIVKSKSKSIKVTDLSVMIGMSFFDCQHGAANRHLAIAGYFNFGNTKTNVVIKLKYTNGKNGPKKIKSNRLLF